MIGTRPHGALQDTIKEFCLYHKNNEKSFKDSNQG